MARRAAALVVVLLAVAWPALGHAAQRLVIVPFQALTSVRSSRAVVMPAVSMAVAAKGYELVTGNRVEQVLRTEGIRYLDSVTPEQVRSILGTVGGDGVVLGTILELNAANPALAVLVQVVTPEGVVWSRFSAARGTDPDGPLGFGKTPKIEEVAVRVLSDAFAGLAPSGALARTAAPYRPDRLAHVYAGPLEGHPRICLLPFESYVQGDSTIPWIAGAAVQDALERSGAAEVVPPASMRAGLVGAEIRRIESLSDLGPALKKTVGTDLFLHGTVLRWDPSTPEVELFLILTDLGTGRVVWSGLHRARGSEYYGVTRPGGETQLSALAARVASELIEAFTRASRAAAHAQHRSKGAS
jgi:hypothetical protein